MRILELSALVALLVVAVAACSDSDGDTTTDGSAPTADGSPAAPPDSLLPLEPSAPALESLGAASPAT